VSMLPIFSLALGYAFRLERVGPLSIIGAAASAVGVAIATGAASGHVDRLGLILILCSNLFYALNFIAWRKLALPLSSGLFLMVTMAQLAIVLTPLALVFEGFSIRWTWKVTLSTLYAGVFGQVVAYIGVMTLVRLGGIFQSTLVTPLIPVWAIFFAVLLLNEPLLGRELVVGALIIGGVVLAILPGGRGGGVSHRGDRARSSESTPRAKEQI
jgi:drug/metabolite transporter (DMT)-like permease